MPSRALSSPLSLVVLGLLTEQPLHPYGIRVLMHESGHDRIVKARPASLYDAVTRLTDAGLVEVLESTRDGRRPERTVYRITDPGRESLRVWVRDGLTDLEDSERFASALSFVYALPRREAVANLNRRAETLAALIEAAHTAHKAALADGVGEIFLTEGRYTHALRQAEYDWLTDFTQQLRDGALKWPRRRHRQTPR